METLRYKRTCSIFFLLFIAYFIIRRRLNIAFISKNMIFSCSTAYYYFHIKLFSSGWFFIHYYYHCGRSSVPDVCKLFCYTHKCHCEQISRRVDNNELINECERNTKYDRDKRRLFHEYSMPVIIPLWCMRDTIIQNTDYRPIVYKYCRKKKKPHQCSEKITENKKKKLRIIFRTMDAFCRVDFLLST